MLVCAGASVCVCARARALRIVSRDKILSVYSSRGGLVGGGGGGLPRSLCVLDGYQWLNVYCWGKSVSCGVYCWIVTSGGGGGGGVT